MGLLLLGACGGQRADPYTVDLAQCTAQGTPIAQVLRWSPAEGDPDSPEYVRIKDLVVTSASHGAYFGACNLATKGQALTLRVADPARQDAGFRGRLLPPMSARTGRADLERLFGPPDPGPDGAGYQALAGADGRAGLVGQWSRICPGLVLRLEFDQRDRLSTLMVHLQ
jgi:hypothetical protein